MLYQMGRVVAATIEEALEIIKAKHGQGTPSIRQCGAAWWEYVIDLEGENDQ